MEGCPVGQPSRENDKLSGLYILVQGTADSTGTGVQLLGHTLNLLAQTHGIQVNAEHIGTGKQGVQAAEVLLPFLHFQTGNDGLKLCQQRIGRGLKGIAGIIDAPQIAGIASQSQGNQHQVGLVQPPLLILTQGLTKADCQLLAGIHGDTLGCIGHEGVGQTAPMNS